MSYAFFAGLPSIVHCITYALRRASDFPNLIINKTVAQGAIPNTLYAFFAGLYTLHCLHSSWNFGLLEFVKQFSRS